MLRSAVELSSGVVQALRSWGVYRFSSFFSKQGNTSGLFRIRAAFWLPSFASVPTSVPEIRSSYSPKDQMSRTLASNFAFVFIVYWLDFYEISKCHSEAFSVFLYFDIMRTRVSSKLSLWRWVNGPQCTQPNRRSISAIPRNGLTDGRENLKLPGSHPVVSCWFSRSKWHISMISSNFSSPQRIWSQLCRQPFPTNVLSLCPEWLVFFLDWMNYLPSLTFTVITTKHGALSGCDYQLPTQN